MVGLKKLSLALGLLATVNAHALVSGDRIKCLDSVSRETYEIKIVDIGDEEAYVRISDSGRFKRFYPSQRVVFDESSEGASFDLLDASGASVEGIFVAAAIEENLRAGGHYYDRGDSRAIDCRLYR